jgi:hypothetical protein
MCDRRNREDEHGEAMKSADGQSDTAALFDAKQKESGERCEEDDGQDKFWKGESSFSADILTSKETGNQRHRPELSGIDFTYGCCCCCRNDTCRNADINRCQFRSFFGITEETCLRINDGHCPGQQSYELRRCI